MFQNHEIYIENLNKINIDLELSYENGFAQVLILVLTKE